MKHTHVLIVLGTRCHLSEPSSNDWSLPGVDAIKMGVAASQPNTHSMNLLPTAFNSVLDPDDACIHDDSDSTDESAVVLGGVPLAAD